MLDSQHGQLSHLSFSDSAKISHPAKMSHGKDSMQHFYWKVFNSKNIPTRWVSRNSKSITIAATSPGYNYC